MARTTIAHLSIPDEPYNIRGFLFGPVGMVVEPGANPTFEDHLAAGEFARRAYMRSGWWMVDWLRYGDSRTDWAPRLEHAAELTGLSFKTLRNLRTLGVIDVSERARDLDHSMYFPVVALEPEERGELITMARTEGWGQRELRREVQARKRTTVIEGQAILEGQFAVLMADCPWAYANSQPSTSSSAKHYPTMTIEELCALPVKAHSTRHAVMGFWVPLPLLGDKPGPFDVIEAWGFEYKTLIAWHKDRGAGGFYHQGDIELFLICTRGRGTPDVTTDLPSAVYAERKGEHSEKPAWFRHYLEKHWTRAPRLELFGRKPVKGWQVYGNDPKLWGAA